MWEVFAGAGSAEDRPTWMWEVSAGAGSARGPTRMDVGGVGRYRERLQTAFIHRVTRPRRMSAYMTQSPARL
jgi:hypothetical protein